MYWNDYMTTSWHGLLFNFWLLLLLFVWTIETATSGARLRSTEMFDVFSASHISTCQMCGVCVIFDTQNLFDCESFISLFLCDLCVGVAFYLLANGFSMLLRWRSSYKFVIKFICCFVIKCIGREMAYELKWENEGKLSLPNWHSAPRLPLSMPSRLQCCHLSEKKTVFMQFCKTEKKQNEKQNANETSNRIITNYWQK